MSKHPLRTLLILATCMIGIVQPWLMLRSHFIDLDDYVIVSATGRAELPETKGGSFALRLPSGERVHALCQVHLPRSYRRQSCIIDRAYRAGLRDEEAVTVVYLRPPREGWDHPLLLSIRGADRTYLSCVDQLTALNLSAARYQTLCEGPIGSEAD